MTVERRHIMISSVEPFDLKQIDSSIDSAIQSQVAAYTIDTFSEGTDEQLFDIIKVKKEAGVKYLLLDMRDNTGGYLETAVNMGKVLLPEGIITSLVN